MCADFNILGYRENPFLGLLVCLLLLATTCPGHKFSSGAKMATVECFKSIYPSSNKKAKPKKTRVDALYSAQCADERFPMEMAS